MLEVPPATPLAPIVGGPDAHGCIPGYGWCAASQKCIRFDEPCGSSALSSILPLLALGALLVWAFRAYPAEEHA